MSNSNGPLDDTQLTRRHVLGVVGGGVLLALARQALGPGNGPLQSESGAVTVSAEGGATGSDGGSSGSGGGIPPQTETDAPGPQTESGGGTSQTNTGGDGGDGTSNDGAGNPGDDGNESTAGSQSSGGPNSGGSSASSSDDTAAGTFCRTIDHVPVEGETYTVSENGNSFSVTIDSVMTLASGKPIGVRFSSIDDIETVYVASNGERYQYSGMSLDHLLMVPKNDDGSFSELTGVTFCGTGVDYYQIDLVGGDPIEAFDNGRGRSYTKEGRMLEAFSVGSNGEVTQNVVSAGERTITVDGEDCTISWRTLGFDERTRTARVVVTLESTAAISEACTVSLAGYLLPEGDDRFVPGNLDDQTFLSADTRTLSVGDSTTLSIDLDA